MFYVIVISWSTIDKAKERQNGYKSIHECLDSAFDWLNKKRNQNRGTIFQFDDNSRQCTCRRKDDLDDDDDDDNEIFIFILTLFPGSFMSCVRRCE